MVKQSVHWIASSSKCEQERKRTKSFLQDPKSWSRRKKKIIIIIIIIIIKIKKQGAGNTKRIKGINEPFLKGIFYESVKIIFTLFFKKRKNLGKLIKPIMQITRRQIFGLKRFVASHRSSLHCGSQWPTSSKSKDQAPAVNSDPKQMPL
jgi:hypothetical protein